ncbi:MULTISPECIES: hypothetical protein [unclassified Corynebacterium]|uniref:hypothetical protein n=1 Tax=unclassified Corynebacterium TaxID=2624378 RepID=UPI000BAA8FF5|nr:MULTISPECIES: hypothetical protein [unclassified Corynebacterium]PAT15875.1 hypothetical protein CKJ84_06580 [Corynebacterium sp. NML 120412]TVX76799.1 hypothetical protein FPP74_10455 [Corynebacterium sp. NML180780]
MVKSNSSGSNDGTITERQAFLGLVGFIVVGLAMSLYGIALIILASLVTLGSIAVGVFLILRSSEEGDAVFRAVSGEVEQLSNDASFDIAEELIAWDKLKYTRGIGTRIAGQDSDIEDIYRRLTNAREELAQANTPVHRIEAVLAVDSVLAIAKELRISE